MSNIIKVQGQPILICSNLLFNTFYKAFLSVVEEAEYKGNPKIIKLVQDLDQINVGLGCVSVDLNDYQLDKDEILILASLFAHALKQTHMEHPLSDNALTLLANFIEKLIEV